MARMVFKTGSSQRAKPFLVEIAAGELVFSEGDLGTEMYIIQEGEVEILKQIRGEERRLALLEKGDFFGEMSILEELPRVASARALEATRLLEVNGSAFGQMLLDNPEISIRMMRKLSRRLRAADEYLKELGGHERLESKEPDPSSTEERVLSPQRLLSEGGETFFLSANRETTIGRRDPVTGMLPDIDLSEVDPDRSTSRRHARIHRRGGKYYLTEEIGTTNGCFIGKTRLETGAPFEINEGDQLRFGLVQLTFLIEP